MAATEKDRYKVLGGSRQQTATLMWSHSRVSEVGSSHPTRTLMRTSSQATECGSIRKQELDIKPGRVTEDVSSHQNNLLTLHLNPAPQLHDKEI